MAGPEPPDYISFFTSPTSIRVEWQEPSLDPGASVKGYRLQYKLGDSGKLVKLKLRVENSHDIEGTSSYPVMIVVCIMIPWG